MKKSLANDYKVIIYGLVLFLLLVGAVFLLDKSCLFPEEESYSVSEDTVPKDKEKAITAPPQRELRLQPFDPNTADEEILRNVGLSDFSIRCIFSYRAKGGVWSSAEDFARVPGLTKGVYKKLLPYIRIADDFRPAAEMVETGKYKRNNVQRDTVLYPVKIKSNERISLNDADTNELKKVPGIGSYYANRIVDLRNRYGGFVSLSQLNDIHGLSDECYQYLTIPDGDVKKINVNTADFETMRQHPYIGYNRARQISDYRRLKGKISSLEQLSLLPGFSEEERKRLVPYIEY